MVGHDSGGLIARHALVGDPRLRAMALLDTEQPAGSQSAGSGRSSPPATFPGSASASAGLSRDRVSGACRSCSAARSPIRACWTGSSTSSSCDRSTRTPHDGTRPCGCCAASTPSTSATSPTCTRASTSPFSSSGAPRTRSSRCSGPSRWSRPSLVPRLEVVPGAGLFVHEERPARGGGGAPPGRHDLNLPRRAHHPRGRLGSRERGHRPARAPPAPHRPVTGISRRPGAGAAPSP